MAGVCMHSYVYVLACVCFSKYQKLCSLGSNMLMGIMYTIFFFISLEVIGPYPSSCYIIAFFKYACHIFCTSVDKHIVPARSVKQTSSFPASDKITGLTVLHQTPRCSPQSKWKMSSVMCLVSFLILKKVPS
jgi:hypothetical protein